MEIYFEHYEFKTIREIESYFSSIMMAEVIILIYHCLYDSDYDNCLLWFSASKNIRKISCEKSLHTVQLPNFEVLVRS